MSMMQPTSANQEMNPEDLREEERLEEALEHLKVLHLQLRALRTTIPRMIEPLATGHPSPQVLWSAYRQAITTANKEVADFKAEMTSEPTQKIFDEARTSRQARPKGIRPWRATEHPDWTTPKKKRKLS